MTVKKLMVGALEVCSLPDFEISGLHIRVDTGAATSSLHVDNIEEYNKDGELWVSFDIHPDIYDVDVVARREAKVIDTRYVKSSSGERQKRHLIETRLQLNGDQWPIYISLSDRSSMTYLMLLGRQAMKNRIIVDPSVEYILSEQQ
ncbi:ATP-dependent zinc protease [Bermanella sp. R86510]|uniref:ATP-dependent zinc protease family protein n=1 Tax=unclassified Bermanella TaxID=2627862 RepID=UPI0037C8693A